MLKAGTVLYFVGLSLLLLYTLLFIVLPEVVYELRLIRRAQHDYRAARGTQHLHQLRASLIVLRSSMQARQDRIRNLEQQMDKLKRKRSEELRAALSRYLVEKHLTEVPSIGPQLSRTIIQYCFRGDLQDLRFAHEIPGIGQTRQQAIMMWVQNQERNLPRLLEGEFPGKERILEKYAEQEHSLRQAIEKERSILDKERALHNQAYAAAQQLQKIKLAHFRKALRGYSGAPPVPAWYLEGVYPPWKPMPEWFQTLLEQYGEEQC